MRILVTIKLMELWLNYSDKSNYMEIILVTVENIDHLFCMTTKILNLIGFIYSYFQKLLESMIRKLRNDYRITRSFTSIAFFQLSLNVT